MKGKIAIGAIVPRGSAMKQNTLFWDVDTQFDFMMPDGRLYVPGAEEIIETVSTVRRFAFDRGYSMMADVDWHSTDDPEISETPDFKTTFPPHCMAGTPGGERVGYLGEVPIDCVDIMKTDSADLSRMAQRNPFHIVIRKNSLDVFENPNTDELVRLISPKHIVVFGVALDFCVACVVSGLTRYEGAEVSLLSDATKGLGATPTEEVYTSFREMGVQVTTFAECRERLACG